MIVTVLISNEFDTETVMSYISERYKPEVIAQHFPTEAAEAFCEELATYYSVFYQ